MMERRKIKGSPPTIAYQAIRTMEKWKKNVLFVVGVGGIIAEGLWFFLLDAEHTHPVYEWAAAAVLMLFSWWAISPEWITRQMDKYAPAFLRSDPRE